MAEINDFIRMHREMAKNVPEKQKTRTVWFGFLYGGRYRTRTYDLPHVKRML